MKDFYAPEFPDIGYLSKLGSAGGTDENIRKDLVSKYLADSEITLISKAYGSRNPIIMYQDCDLGWLIVTNKRILFWSDESIKPHIAINFENISTCSSKWAIMKLRSVKINVNNKFFKFGTHKDAARLIEKQCNNLKEK